MDYEFSEEFDEKYYKLNNVRLTDAINKTLILFSKNPHNPQLNNHILKGDLKGKRSFHIIAYRTNDYCILYKEITEKDSSIYAYLLTLAPTKSFFNRNFLKCTMKYSRD